MVKLLRERAPTAEILLDAKVGQVRQDVILKTDNFDLVIKVKRGVTKLADLANEAEKYWEAYAMERGLDYDHL